MTRREMKPAPTTAAHYPTLTELRHNLSLHSVGLATALAALGVATPVVAQDPPNTVEQMPMIADAQLNERIPATGDMTIYLSDGTYTGLSLHAYGHLNAPLDTSFLDDPGALDLAIYETIGGLTCDTLNTPDTKAALREALQALMAQPEQLSHVTLEITFCRYPTHTRGMIRNPEYE